MNLRNDTAMHATSFIRTWASTDANFAGCKRCRVPRANAGDARLAVASNPMAIGASFIIGLEELGPAFHRPTEANSNDGDLHPPELVEPIIGNPLRRLL